MTSNTLLFYLTKEIVKCVDFSRDGLILLTTNIISLNFMFIQEYNNLFYYSPYKLTIFLVFEWL
jgi:hypothetical protein